MPFQGDDSMGRHGSQGDAIGGCRRPIACPGLASDAASRRGPSPGRKRSHTPRRHCHALCVRNASKPFRESEGPRNRPVRPKGVKRSARGRAQRRPGNRSENAFLDVVGWGVESIGLAGGTLPSGGRDRVRGMFGASWVIGDFVMWDWGHE